MSLARSAYEIATTAAEPLLDLVVRRRVKTGKEIAGRTGERFAKTMATRLPAPLVWMHGASIGETRILLELMREMDSRRGGLSFLLTSQTRTSASLIGHALQDGAITAKAVHQFAPLDTPAIARRFVGHWSPALAVFAEGEIWPNLLKQLRAKSVPTALINARMTEKSLKGWARWAGLSRELFGGFDVILAADTQTAEGLSDLAGREIAMPGNLKSALTLPGADIEETARLSRDFIGSRGCLAAISTHEGEETLVLDALGRMKERPACIIVPRHPERAEAILQEATEAGFSVSRRSTGDRVQPDTHVLLADTLGEVGLFARLADTVYLGGGHAPGIGGHNPVEILRLGKPVATGPDVFNFADMKRDFAGRPGYHVVETAAGLASGFPFSPPDAQLLQSLEDAARAPLEATADALVPLLPGKATR